MQQVHLDRHGVPYLEAHRFRELVEGQKTDEEDLTSQSDAIAGRGEVQRLSQMERRCHEMEAHDILSRDCHGCLAAHGKAATAFSFPT